MGRNLPKQPHSQAFKKCGLANDAHGRENHLIEVQKLASYKVPPKEYVRVPEPYNPEETQALFDAEIKLTKTLKQKRSLQKRKLIFERKCKKIKIQTQDLLLLNMPHIHLH